MEAAGACRRSAKFRLRRMVSSIGKIFYVCGVANTSGLHERILRLLSCKTKEKRHGRVSSGFVVAGTRVVSSPLRHSKDTRREPAGALIWTCVS